MNAARRVIVIDEDVARRRELMQQLEDEGFSCLGFADANELEGPLSQATQTVVVRDVSLPRSWTDVAEEQLVLRAIVGERCPIVLYGDRGGIEISELEGSASRPALHIPSDARARKLTSLLKRLMPVVPLRPTSPPSRPDFSVVTASNRILLIDDSEITLEIMQEHLARSGFDVRIAVSLGEVRSLVANWAPNIIVADVVRPDIPGNQLCARLKATVCRSDVLVVLCSSLPDRQLSELARAARADGYVSKAYGLEELVDRMLVLSRKLLGGSVSQEAEL